MKYSTLDLICRTPYSRSISDKDAIDQLKEKGFPRPLSYLLALIVGILTCPVQILIGMGGDNWDMPVTPRDLLVDIAFSLMIYFIPFFVYDLFQFLMSCLNSGCSAKALPLRKSLGLVSLFLLTFIIPDSQNA